MSIDEEIKIKQNAQEYYEKDLSYNQVYRQGVIDGYAKAIDDFIVRLENHTQENWIDHLEYGITWDDIKKVAEQLKGEKQ